MDGQINSINRDVSNGYVEDFVSGITVKATPEEVEAVQVFSRSLVEDYEYPKELLQTKPQYRVKVRPSDTKKEYPVDIAVFSQEPKNEDNLKILVECKKKSRKDGLNQLQNYLTLSRARLGVWFNGEERLYIKKSEKEGKVYFEEIPNIPKYGQRLEDIGKFKREDLKEPSDLKTVFKTIRNHLAGNTVGATRDEVLAQQLINLIFCKIYDEKFTKPEDIVTFRAGVGEDPEIVKARALDLFERVKSKYKEVIDFSDKITLDTNSVVYIVGELQNFAITESQRDVIAEAFEMFIGASLKGDQGQFFTPRNVIRLMVEVIDPKPDDLVIDPACGSGGFLVESLRHMWNHLDDQAVSFSWSPLALNEEKIATAIHNIRGIEKDEFLSKVSKAYMAIMGDGKGGIFCEDSLERPSNWKFKTQQNVELGKFDIVLTNPPFGKDIKVVGEDKLKQFELAYKWKSEKGASVKTNKLKKSEQPQLLFIERCFQLLKDGGKLGIVLPETFFHAPSLRYVLDLIMQHNIQWLIDLPHNTFRPHNNAKCIVLIVQKGKRQQDSINMAVAEEMGHDHQGKPIFRWDYKTRNVDKSKIWDDIPLILAELKGDEEKKYTFKVDAGLVESKGVLVPRYYWQTKEVEIEQYALDEDLELVSIQSLLDQGVLKCFDGHGSPPSEYKGRGEVPYIRVKDIVGWEVYKDPTAFIPEEVYLKKKGKNKKLREGDVLYVRRGSYRIGSVAMVSPFDTEVLLTREILVLRVLENTVNLTPFYLLYLLSHKLTAMQAANKILIETTLPNIADRWKELRLPMHKDLDTRLRLSAKVEEIMKKKWDAIADIRTLADDLSDLI